MSEEEAKAAVETFNNVIPEEFINNGHPGYIEYDDNLKPFRVILKA